MAILFDVAFIIGLLLFLWRGFKRGLFRSIIDLILMGASVLISNFCAPFVAEFYYKNFLYSNLLTNVNNILFSGDGSANQMKKALDFIRNMPSFITESMSSCGISLHDIMNVFSKEGNNAEKILELLKPGIIYFITLIAIIIISTTAFSLLRSAFKFLYNIRKVPILGPADSILGLVVGLGKFAVCLFVFVLALKSAFFLFPKQLMSYNIDEGVNNSKIFKQVYDLDLNLVNNQLKGN